MMEASSTSALEKLKLAVTELESEHQAETDQLRSKIEEQASIIIDLEKKCLKLNMAHGETTRQTDLLRSKVEEQSSIIADLEEKCAKAETKYAQEKKLREWATKHWKAKEAETNQYEDYLSSLHKLLTGDDTIPGDEGVETASGIEHQTSKPRKGTKNHYVENIIGTRHNPHGETFVLHFAQRLSKC
jgi:chromosome segregation ATPase